ncbi:uncharacterized protein L201_003362 [Kwoniella dendrophila CBS 6074]|uniref:P-loop containing nucleoside triphosphate hydrolase protein n=1 Tax=Kwoniella dendrophila CBS 6074 TaxID=1295534 RepID=A0AAX4JSQ2_9TREE
MSIPRQVPMTDPGPKIGTPLHDHQKAAVSELLFKESDYGSLYKGIVRQDPSLKNRKFLDLSSFGHMWLNEGDGTWSNAFTHKVSENETRPLQGKGMLLADEMGTGKSLIILALIASTIEAANEWVDTYQFEPEIPTYRLPKGYSMKDIVVDIPPESNPQLATLTSKLASENDHDLDCVITSIKSAQSPKSCATLIVCPKSVLGIWHEHLEQHWKGDWTTLGGNIHRQGYRQRPLLVHDHYANPKYPNLQALYKANIIITSYEALLTDSRKGTNGTLNNMIFYRVILDEGHRIRNTNTQSFRLIENLKKRHIHILTAAQVTRNPATDYRPLTTRTSIKMRWFRYFLDTRPKQKLVVFHHWKFTFKETKAVLKAAGYSIVYLQSNLSMEERVQITARFNRCKQDKICLLSSIKVGGEGLSMVGANACVFLDLMWNPSWHAQAMDRLHRHGQKHAVTCYIPMIQVTYEDRIWTRQQIKRALTRKLFPNDPKGEINLEAVPPELKDWLKRDVDPLSDEDEDEDEDAEPIEDEDVDTEPIEVIEIDD